VWDEPHPTTVPARRWYDWALVAALASAALLEGLLRTDLTAPVVSVALGIALTPTLLWRRTRPLLMVAIAMTACTAAELVIHGDAQLQTLGYVLLLPYSLLRWGSGRAAVLGTAIILAKLSLSAALDHLSPGTAVGGFFAIAAVSALGAAMRYRARARARELDQVKLLERERLARDLHDTVAHHVSAMAIRAQAGLAVSESRPEAAVEALRVIEAEASRALTEMRAMVRVLRRDEPADRAPSPRVGDLESLAGGSRTGPAVDVQVQGDVDDLPPPVAAAVYRLAQESITNARRHARHATRIQVCVAADDTSVRLCVSDDGDTSAIRANGSPGFGLIGMAERAGLLGGVCKAGPDPDRGWTVTAVLPRAGSAA
jgi:signal transduction histidine kinase